LSQVPGLLGLSYSMLNPGNPVAWVREIIAAPITALFGGASVVLILLLRTFFPRLPGILIVTILGIAASTALGYEQLGGKVVGALPAGLPALTLPDAISFEQHRTLWPAAFVLALISFTEAMTSCRVIA